MPLYEYQCDACGHRFEIIQKFADSPIETCPKCGQSVHKVVSSPAFQFKGSGWYVTDYAKKDQAAEAKTEQKSETAAKDKSEKSDTADKVDRADKSDRTGKDSQSSGESTSSSSSTTSTKE